MPPGILSDVNIQIETASAQDYSDQVGIAAISILVLDCSLFYISQEVS